MKYLIIILSLLFNSLIYSKDMYFKDLLKKDEIFYEKFSNVPFTGKITGLLEGNFKIWNDINLNTLNKNRSLLTKVNQTILCKLCECREYSFFRRIISFLFLGLYRQTIFGNLALFFAIILKRL